MGIGRRLASQSSVIFAVRLAGAGLVFLAQAVIARIWGAEILGEYLLIVAMVNLIAVTLPLGFHTVGSYFAAEYRAKGAGRTLRAFAIRCYLHVLGLGAILLLFGEAFAGVVHADILGQHWIPVALLAIATALVYVNGALLVGLKRPMAGFFADTLFRPLAVIAALLIGARFASPDEGFSAMLWIVALGYVAIALVHCGFVVATVRAVPGSAADVPGEGRRWWRFATPWVLISLATDFFFDIDLLLLSGLLSREELAIFGVCTRVFSLAAFGVAAVYAVTMPDMYEANALSDRTGFNMKVGDANLTASAVSLLLFIVVAALGPFALMLFGSDFIAGALPLAILCLALVVRSAFGPASLVLSIRDRPYASLPSVALGMLALALGNVVLVPPLGLTGAGLAALVAIFAWSASQWWTAKRITGIDVSIVPRLRGRASAVPAE